MTVSLGVPLCKTIDILVRMALLGMIALWHLYGVVHWSFQPVIFNIYTPDNRAKSETPTDRLTVQQPVCLLPVLSHLVQS